MKPTEILDEELNRLSEGKNTEILDEASRKDSLGKQLTAVLYGDKGSSSLRPGMMNKVFGVIGKFIPREEFEKNHINMNTYRGDIVVANFLSGYFHDDGVTIHHVARNVKEIVRNVFTKYTSKAIGDGKVRRETKPNDENYFGWGYWLGDDYAWVHKKARVEIEKELGKFLAKEFEKSAWPFNY